MTVDPPADNQEPERISTDVSCINCDYNLRTLRGDGRCPECGTPVAKSLTAPPATGDGLLLAATIGVFFPCMGYIIYDLVGPATWLAWAILLFFVLTVIIEAAVMWLCVADIDKHEKRNSNSQRGHAIVLRYLILVLLTYILCMYLACTLSTQFVYRPGNRNVGGLAQWGYKTTLPPNKNEAFYNFAVPWYPTFVFAAVCPILAMLFYWAYAETGMRGDNRRRVIVFCCLLLFTGWIVHGCASNIAFYY